MKTITLIRHAESETNVKQIHNSNPSHIYKLTPRGYKQVENIAEQLKDKSFDCMYSSQIHRAKETAKIINKHHNLEIIEDNRINEKKAGIEGGPLEEFLTLEKEANDKMNFKINDGESWNELIQRVHEFLDEILNSQYSNIVIISHGDPLVAMIQYFRGDKNVFNIEMPRNCEVITFNV
ncbi:MAG: histidine phosphatase family protein [Candidatus Nanoarchaeia archaeon]